MCAWCTAVERVGVLFFVHSPFSFCFLFLFFGSSLDVKIDGLDAMRGEERIYCCFSRSSLES